jgi:metallophosphoesterase (TIGR00282 family)
MRFLFLGDIVGRSGREAVMREVPRLRAKYALDAVVVNGENAAAGFGITPAICQQLYACGVDCITTGNHVWDQREIMSAIEGDKRLLRPINFPEGTPGAGVAVLSTETAGKLLVVNAMARLFMEPLDDPFAAIRKLLAGVKLGSDVAAVLVDFHGEATSEKMAMGHFCDGQASLVVGTHSHVPTADLQILPGGTAYQSDAGMCGDYDSVIGMNKASATDRFVRKIRAERLSPAEGEGTVCGLIVETHAKTGLALRAAPVRAGGRLAATEPAWEPILAA